MRVRTPAGDALPLTPLLSVQLCAVCGQWTAFYLDKYDKDKHRAQFLDFVEGHSNDLKDLEPLPWPHIRPTGLNHAVRGVTVFCPRNSGRQLSRSVALRLVESLAYVSQNQSRPLPVCKWLAWLLL